MECIKVFAAVSTVEANIPHNFRVLIIRGKAAVFILAVVCGDQGVFGNLKKFGVVVTVRAGQQVDYFRGF